MRKATGTFLVVNFGRPVRKFHSPAMTFPRQRESCESNLM